MPKRPSKYTRFVLPVTEQLIFYRKFGLDIKRGFLLQPSVVLSVEVMSVTNPADSVSGSFSLSLKRQLQKGKNGRNNTGNSSNILVDMEVQGRIGKISKWICTTVVSTSHSFNGRTSEQEECCYLCIHHSLQKEWVSKCQLYWVVKQW